MIKQRRSECADTQIRLWEDGCCSSNTEQDSPALLNPTQILFKGIKNILATSTVISALVRKAQKMLFDKSNKYPGSSGDRHSCVLKIWTKMAPSFQKLPISCSMFGVFRSKAFQFISGK